MAELGIIEGYYGRPWSWEAREQVIASLAPYGYRFYFYAPKADAFLRKRWREDFPQATFDHLQGLAQACRTLGVRFGVGLSPFEIYRGFDSDAREELGRKLLSLDAIGCEVLAILFDDMRGDLPDLAETQVEIVHWVAERTRAKDIVVCPSYYTDDPVLDRFFGQRPKHYLETFGRLLDRAIHIFWTGEEVCAREFTAGHLRRVTEQLGRKPFLWDNYPVNDGTRMSHYLHLRAFTGRPATIGDHIVAHAINPALQPTLSLIPALTLVDSYRLGEAYEYGRAFAAAAETVLGSDLAARVHRDLIFLQDFGLDRLGNSAAHLRDHYTNIEHQAAKEILDWLNGEYRFEGEV